MDYFWDIDYYYIILVLCSYLKLDKYIEHRSIYNTEVLVIARSRVQDQARI